MTLGAISAAAQETQVAFGATQADPSLPVEVTSEKLNVNQEDGSAEFLGNVIVIQGEMRLTAERVLVIYNEERSGIERMEATEDVVLVSPPDAAEGRLGGIHHRFRRDRDEGQCAFEPGAQHYQRRSDECRT